MIAIGIDPGVTTGYAVWNAESFQLVEVRSMGIVRAMRAVLDLFTAAGTEGRELIVIVEDARKRGVFTKMDREQEKYGAAVREGVGSVKRDCSIWEEFLTHHGIPHEMRAPRMTKMDAEPFKQLTGWSQLTNKHARDAAMIVFQLNRTMLRLKLQTYNEEQQREKNGEPALHPRRDEHDDRRAVAAGRRVRNAIRFGRRKR